jgi:hypothetical protein
MAGSIDVPGPASIPARWFLPPGGNSAQAHFNGQVEITMVDEFTGQKLVWGQKGFVRMGF